MNARSCAIAAPGPLALHDVAGPLGDLDEVVDERVDARATTRCVPLRIVRGLTGSLKRLPLLGRYSVLTTLPSSEKITRWIWRPVTTTLNGVP